MAWSLYGNLREKRLFVEEERRRAEEERISKLSETNRIIANVQTNNNILLTNITSFIQDNSDSKLFHKKFKKYLLNDGVSIETISKIFCKIFLRNTFYQLGQNIIKPININKKLSSGSYGTVYGNKSINKLKLSTLTINSTIPVAIKILNIQNKIQTFIYYKESLIHYMIYHLSDERYKRSIPQIYSIKYIRPNMMSIIMEQIQGNTLLDIMYKNPNPLVFIDYIIQLVHLLKYLHETFGFIHADIKLENIMVRDDNTIVLLDYGCSSINNLPTINNLDTNFSLSTYDDVYDNAHTINIYTGIDIVMILSMIKYVLDNIYSKPKYAQKHFTNQESYHSFFNIIYNIFVHGHDQEHSLKRKLNSIYDIFLNIDYNQIRNRKINGLEKYYARNGYDNMLHILTSIEEELQKLFNPSA